MATTSGNLAAGKANVGQGGNGTNGRFGLKTKLVTGMVILGCTAALLLGGLRAQLAAQTRPQAAPQATSLSAGTDDLAITGCIGSTGPFACQVGQSLFGTDDFGTTGCIGMAGPFACAMLTPRVSGASTAFVPDQFTYREDHRGER